MRVGRTYIRICEGPAERSIRTRPLDCNDGAARRVVPEKRPDPKLRNESFRQVSPSQVRDARGPHDGNEHIRKQSLQMTFTKACASFNRARGS